MRKTWSITTTTRNPFRLRSQLIVLKNEFANKAWDREAQIKFQVLLIKNRLYGYNEDTGFSKQFTNGLSKEHEAMFANFEHELSYDEARAIFESKKYQDPPMRGRQSFNPHKKMGFVYIDEGNILRITSLADYFTSSDYDLSEIFFRSFLKWQIPNPDSKDYKKEDGYDIKPFVGTLHLINKVNMLWEKLGNSRKGISKNEFILFAPSLVNYQDIDTYANKIIVLRQKMAGKSKREQAEIFNAYSRVFAAEFLGSSDEKQVNSLLSNLRDYGDNAIKYFRYTSLLYIRGGGFYVDLEPRRNIEIQSLLEHDNGSSAEFETLKEYQSFLSDIQQPILPWETPEQYKKILKELLDDIQASEQKQDAAPQVPINTYGDTLAGLKKYASELRAYRRRLYDMDVHTHAQNTANIQSFIKNLRDIYSLDDRPVELERLSTLGLHALNDAVLIKPNYPVGDDNQPTFTAPANVPDIECYYANVNAICEVTMLTSRDQFYNEGQPVMRHLRDFEDKHQDKPAYCLFIAPSIHRDTVNTYWNSVKYEYEGSKQRIIPFTISNYIDVLHTLSLLKDKGAYMKHGDLFELYDRVVGLTSQVSNSIDWLNSIPDVIKQWSDELLRVD